MLYWTHQEPVTRIGPIICGEGIPHPAAAGIHAPCIHEDVGHGMPVPQMFGLLEVLGMQQRPRAHLRRGFPACEQTPEIHGHEATSPLSRTYAVVPQALSGPWSPVAHRCMCRTYHFTSGKEGSPQKYQTQKNTFLKSNRGGGRSQVQISCFS